MNREEYDPSIEPNWKFDRSIGVWNYMDTIFQGPIIEIDPSKENLQTESFVQVSTPSFSASAAHLHSFMIDVAKSKSMRKGFLWNLSLELNPMKAPVTDEGQLRSMKWSLSEFNRQLFSLYRRKTLGVVLYRSHVKETGFYWDLEQIEQFIHWLGDFKEESSSLNAIKEAKECLHSANLEKWRLFCQNSCWTHLYSLFILSQYWHYLASGLEEDCPALVELDVRGLSLQEQVFLLARPLFDHVKLIGSFCHKNLSSLIKEEGVIKPSREQASKLALLVPDTFGFETAGLIAEAIQKLDFAGLDYRVILQQDLVFEWQELEELIVFADLVSDQALRSLRGFIAASGKIYAIGTSSKLEAILEKWPSHLPDLLLTKH